MIFVMSLAFLLSPEESSSPNTITYEASSEGDTGFRAVDELTKDTRTGHWMRAIGIWQENPILGVGWSQFRGRWTMHHSAYLQVLVEVGVLGALAWAWVLWCCFTQCRYVYTNRRLLGDWEITIAELGIAIILSCLIHAFGESAILAATMPLAIALGLSIHLIDDAVVKIDELQSMESRYAFEDEHESSADDAVMGQL